MKLFYKEKDGNRRILHICGLKFSYKKKGEVGLAVKDENIFFSSDKSSKTRCRVCGEVAYKIFTQKILGKYDVKYYQCSDCGMIFTEKPYWLDEAYSNAITSLDLGLLYRNSLNSEIVENIIYNYFDSNAKFLDYGGGYGTFVRLMRDKGFDFYREDIYCENLFAKHFDIEDLKTEDRKFECVTAFEVMEHIENPIELLDIVFKLSDNFLFTTETISSTDENWWYLTPEHGQHISFYSKKSLEHLAKKFGKKLYSNGCLHILTNKNIEYLNKKYKGKKLKSLLMKDFAYVKGLINDN